MNKVERYSKLRHIETNPKDIRIDFNEFPIFKIEVKEIYNCEISGTYTKDKGVFHGNIVMSSLVGFKAVAANLNRVDWKDSNFKECAFENTSFDTGAMINCHLIASNFYACHFYDLAITGSVFYETEFRDCDLSAIVIENCRFFKCSFINCKTSNKIFEHSLLFDSKFDNTDIQIQTIEENFGLEKGQFKNCAIRTASTDEVFILLDFQALQEMCSTGSSLHNFFKFKIEYFLNPTIVLWGSDLFDNVFEIEEWIPLCRAQSTFLNMFKSFHDFFLILFEQNKALLIVIYKLKELTGWIGNQDFVRNNFELYPIIIGYDLGLTRIISQGYEVIKDLVENLAGRITFLVEGPLEKSYYYIIFEKYINGDFEITKLKKQNSPNLLEISAISSVLVQIVSMFVVTRVKLEFNKKKGKENIKRGKREYAKNKQIQMNPYQLVSFKTKTNEEDTLKLYLSKSLTYQIDYSEFKSKDMGMVRHVIIDIHENSK